MKQLLNESQSNMTDFTYAELRLLLEWADCALYFDGHTPEDKELKQKIVGLMDDTPTFNKIFPEATP